MLNRSSSTTTPHISLSLMESRKRPHTDDGDVSVAKKRALTSPNGTPHVNGNNEQTEDEHIFHAGLENFRKEAIYRRMKHYSRENERNLTRIQDLERRKATCEANMAAMSACWAQLIETVRLLVNAEDSAPTAIKGEGIFDIASRLDDDDEESVPRLKSALGDAAKATQDLVTKFVSAGVAMEEEALRNKSFKECQEARSECIALRSQLQLTRKQLEECEEDRDKLHADLVATQNRIERSHSQTVQSLELKQPPPPSKENSVSGDAEDTQRKPSSPSESPRPSSDTQNNQSPVKLELPSEIANSREAEIQDLHHQISKLKCQITDMTFQKAEPDANLVCARLAELLALEKKSTADLKAQVDILRREKAELKASEERLVDLNKTDSGSLIQELKSMAAKRDAENARLREQRDQLSAEIGERKQKDSVKLASLAEFKNLAESRGGRLETLSSQLRRCKARLAANELHEDLMTFLLEGKTDEAGYVKSLEARLQEAEVRVTALSQSLSTLSQEHPEAAAHIKARAEAEEKLAHATSQLAEFQKVFGNVSSLPLETSELVQRLQTQATEVERLRLLNIQHQQAEASLYEELEKLSTAWEAFDTQLSNKVFDLASMEDRLQKTIIEKAKSDNKFFSAMRDKEAIDLERKMLQRVVEKQGTVIERLTEQEKAFDNKDKKVMACAMASERARDRAFLEAKDARARNVVLETELKALSSGKVTVRNLVDGYQAQMYSATRKAREAENALVLEKEAVKKELQRIKEDAAARVVHKHGSGSKDDAEYQHLRSLLMCSTCGSNFRSVVITKCMHTFCKPCVDARIQTRQRKCPACNLPFGQADVSTLYMQ